MVRLLVRLEPIILLNLYDLVNFKSKKSLCLLFIVNVNLSNNFIFQVNDILIVNQNYTDDSGTLSLNRGDLVEVLENAKTK